MLVVSLVAAEAPSFTDPPQEAKAAIGQTILLKCRVFGAPKPVIVWKRDNIVVVGDRYRTTEKGDLEITVSRNVSFSLQLPYIPFLPVGGSDSM